MLQQSSSSTTTPPPPMGVWGEVSISRCPWWPHVFPLGSWTSQTTWINWSIWPSVEKWKCSGVISIYLCIPGTQMTPVLLGKDLVLEAWSPKIEDKQVPGIYIYIHIYTFIYLQPDGLTGSVSGVRCPYIDQGFNALSRSSVDHVQRTAGQIQPWIFGQKNRFLIRSRLWHAGQGQVSNEIWCFGLSVRINGYMNISMIQHMKF